MSTPAHTSNQPEYRPNFASLPCTILADRVSGNSDVCLSFPFLTGYQHISFEEQRLTDMDSPNTGGVGLSSASAIRSLKAACSFSEVEPEERAILMSPSLPLITVHVTSGHGAMDFGIHQNILEHYSPFFKALLRADSAPSLIKNEDEPVVPQSPKVSAVICLEADLAAFKLYTEWVYSGHLVSDTLRIQDTRSDALGQAYLLGEKLLDYGFKNAVLDAILNKIIVEGRVNLTLPNLIFDKTCHTSPLRKLLVDLHVWYGHKD
ncbi:hypothetical protein E4T43_07487 [Aureobasidium subglaciale]|nr:hypothetical protein E4T43_07487 [Aureobasidium subglaciale]